MKKIDLGQLVAILANIGVIAGIVFLGVELRQTQRAIGAQAYQARAFQAFDFHMEMVDRPELEALFRRSLASDFDPSSLTTEDAYKLQRFFLALRADVDNEYYQYQNGFLDDGFYMNTTRRDIKSYTPIWRSLGVGELRPDFSVEADRIIADPSIIDLIVPIEN